MSESVSVYYVTAACRGLESDEAAIHAAAIEEAVTGVKAAPVVGMKRVEVAKFFSRAAAESHAESLHVSWLDVRVESRTEDKSAQHASHAGV